MSIRLTIKSKLSTSQEVQIKKCKCAATTHVFRLIRLEKILGSFEVLPYKRSDRLVVATLFSKRIGERGRFSIEAGTRQNIESLTAFHILVVYILQYVISRDSLIVTTFVVHYCNMCYNIYIYIF